MDTFFSLFLTISPLYLIVFLGYIAKKFLDVEGHNISKLMFYIISPFIVFQAVSAVPVTLKNLSLPLTVFLMSTFFCLLFYSIGKKVLKDDRANLLGQMTSIGNTGYFGIPVALSLFDEGTVALYIIALQGVTFFEISGGYYTVAKGKYSASDALLKVLKLPTLYAFFLGILYSALGLKIPSFTHDFFLNIRGAYVVLGMMIIGLSIGAMDKIRFDFKLTGLAFLGRFVAWPMLTLALILLDQNYMQFYSEEIYKVFFLLSIVPLAANSVVIATLLNTHPHKVATTVLLSTIFALVYVPFMVMLWF